MTLMSLSASWNRSWAKLSCADGPADQRHLLKSARSRFRKLGTEGYVSIFAPVVN